MAPWRWLLQQATLSVAVLVLAGCAGKPLEYPGLADREDLEIPRAVELTGTPFFPDDSYYCGPAALATLLVASGVETTDTEIVERVYLPESQGSLQKELLGAARRADRIPYQIEPHLKDLLSEVQHGNPVLVLQNLALERLPVWHYAVVVGYDLDEQEITLRSEEQKRQTLSMRRFERTWQRADRWAIVIPEPGQIPASATADNWVAAVAELERQQRWEAAKAGYRAAQERWPQHSTAWFGLGNVYYANSDYRSAAKAYQQAIEHDEDFAAAWHNLAWALLRQGKVEGALEAAQRSEHLAPEHPRYGSVSETIRNAAEEADVL
ncbi:PA2778 family cysteine peptidase [Halorhodospira halochloris]|uniref:PA2778 family cysteine peptidase n=1 Tax=Halorhodospira halochloris TaxID=1052 RepID=UPI001EE81043|nr:PA2778 family cysteine peptidase [Halorhodospira halochloris]MCG5548400.1 PA2778 family cysteine peptidase [Halorhodospira halochloris]